MSASFDVLLSSQAAQPAFGDGSETAFHMRRHLITCPRAHRKTMHVPERMFGQIIWIAIKSSAHAIDAQGNR